MIRYAWLDAADPKELWIGGDIVAAGKTLNRPALAAMNFRNYLGNYNEHLESNFGDDLFSSVRGVSGNNLWFINFSRAYFKYHLKSIGHAVDWCTKYVGTRSMGNCPPQSSLPPVSELPEYSEIGFGSMMIPYWLMSIVFPRIMQYEGFTNSDYMAWIHTKKMNNAYIGPHINVDCQMDARSWHHEMMHRLATNMALWDKNADHTNPNLMNDHFPDLLVSKASELFCNETNDSQTCLLGTDNKRCRGFTGAYGNYDVSSCQHALIELVLYYTENGNELRRFVYSDLRAGIDLLKRKYDWVRKHIFGGIEFSKNGVPIYPICIINKHSNKALDVTSWSLENNTPIQQYSLHKGDNQRWLLIPESDGHYHIMAMHSGCCLDVAGVSYDNGTKIQQYQKHNGANQLWSIISDGQGAYEIVVKHSKKCLEVANWSMNDGGSIEQYDPHGGDNQKWIFQ